MEEKLYGVLGYCYAQSVDFICLDGSGTDIGDGEVAVPMTKKEAKKHLKRLQAAYPQNDYTLFKMKIKEA